MPFVLPSFSTRFFYWIGGICLSAMAIFLVSLALLPSLLSTSWGQKYFLAAVNERISGTVSAQRISLSWFGNQRFEGVILKDDQDSFVLSFEELETRSSLVSLFWHSDRWIPFTLQGFNAVFVKDSEGETNFRRSISTHPAPSVSSESSTSITVHDVYANLSVADGQDPHSWSFHVRGNSQDGEKVGEFDVSASFRSNSFPQASALAYDWEQLADFLEKSGTKVTARARHFPTPILDRLLALYSPGFRGIARQALGDTLDLTLENTAEKSGLQWQASIHTPYLEGKGILQLQKDRWTIASPATLHWSLPASAANQLLTKMGRDNLHVVEPISAELEIRSFSLPMQWSPFRIHWEQADLQGQCSTAPILGIADDKPFAIEGLQLQIAHAEQEEGLLLSLNGFLLEDGERSPMKVHASTSHLGNFYTLFTGAESPLDFQLETEEFPLPLLDLAMNTRGAIVAALGEHFRFAIDLHRQKEKKLEARVHIETENFSVPELLFTVNHDMELAKPLYMQFTLSPQLVDHLFPADVAPHIRQNISVQAALNKLTIPFRRPIQEFWSRVCIDFDVAVDLLHLSQWGPLGNIRFSDLRFHISGDGIEKTRATLWAKAESCNRRFITPEVFGGMVDAFVEAKMGLKNGKVHIPSLFGAVKSDLGEFHLVGAFDPEGNFHLTAPAEGSYTVTNSALIDMGFIRPGQPLLESPAPLSLRVEPENAEDPLFSLSSQTFKGAIQLQPMIFRKDSHRVAALHQLYIPWEIDGPGKQIKAKIQGTTWDEETQSRGSFEGEYRALDWLTEIGELQWGNRQAGFHLNFEKFPMTLANVILRRDDLPYLFGPTMDASISFSSAQGRKALAEGTLKIESTTPLFKGCGEFFVKEGRLRAAGKEAVHAQWTLTPEGYSVLRQRIKGSAAQDDTIYLEEPANVVLHLEDFDLPLNKEGEWMTSCSLKASLMIEHLAVQDLKHRQSMNLSNIQGTILSQNLAKNLEFTLHTEAEDARNPHSTRTDLLTHGVLRNLHTPEGLFDPYSLQLSLDAEAEELPIGLLSNLFFLPEGMQEKMDALIGETADVRFHVDIKELGGAILANIHGKNGDILLDGAIRNGTFTLNRPFEAKVAIHPQLSRSILQDIVPLLRGAEKADHPLTIRVYPEGFSFPLLNYSFKKICIQKAEIDLGKVEFSDEGELATVLEILKPAKSDQVSVWFTPLFFSFDGGVLNCQRLDMLVNGLYPIATWGKVDFLQDKVKMVIGLTGTAIQHAFEVSNMDEDYMLQLDVQGTTHHAKIDKAKATTRISALVAQKHGGVRGKFFGTMLQMAAGDVVDPQPPAPTTYPFPWSPFKDDSYLGDRPLGQAGTRGDSGEEEAG